MKYLQILNAVLAALGASFALILGVVCLLYAIYVGEAPQLARDLPALGAMTLAFAALGGVGGLTFWAQRRQHAWAWPMETALALSVAGIVMLVLQLRN